MMWGGDFIRNENPPDWETYLLLYVVQQREAIVEKKLHHVGRIRWNYFITISVCRILWAQLYALMISMLFPSGIKGMHFNGKLFPA